MVVYKLALLVRLGRLRIEQLEFRSNFTGKYTSVGKFYGSTAGPIVAVQDSTSFQIFETRICFMGYGCILFTEGCFEARVRKGFCARLILPAAAPCVKQPDREVSSLILPRPLARNTTVMVPSGPNRAGTAVLDSRGCGPPLSLCACCADWTLPALWGPPEAP